MEHNKAIITGTIQQISETRVFESGFSKREVVINTGTEYPQSIPVNFFKDKCSVLDNYIEGQSVEISVDIRGREYMERFYIDLIGWKITEIKEETIQHPEATDNNPGELDLKSEDGLPF